MSRFIERIRAISGDLPYWQRLTTERATEALAAALLHDVGHGPFSHLFEEAMPSDRSHEDWSARIIRDPRTDIHKILTAQDASLPERVVALIQGKHELPYLAHAVSGTFDVDRCDYLLRDAHFSGVSYGSYDLDWLLRSFCLAPSSSTTSAPSLAIDGTKGLPAIESFTLSRLFMFQQVYFHKASRASDWLLSKILGEVRRLVRDGLRVPGTPRAVESLARGEQVELSDYLELDDAIMWTALLQFEKSDHKTLADLSRRLNSRKLFKSFELFGEDATIEGRTRCLNVARRLSEEAGLDPRTYVGLDVPSVATFDDSKDPLTVIFPDGSERRPAEVSFLLGRLRGQHLSRPRVIYPPEIRDALLSQLGRGGSPLSQGQSRGTLAGGSFHLSGEGVPSSQRDSSEN